MAEDSASLETSKLVKLATGAQKSLSLKWKIGAALGGTILLLGVFVLFIVYYFTGNALRKQVDLRSSAIATNLSDAAAPYVARRSALELDSLVSKYGRLEGVAYAYVTDANGSVVASSAQPFPAELKNLSEIKPDSRTESSREVAIKGRPIYETRVPVLDGQLGAVRVGLWADSVREDVQSTILPIILFTAVCLVLGALLSILVAGTIIKPIIELAAAADAISHGQLDEPIVARTDDEIGELARAIERMRASLKAAISRLSRT